MVFEIKSDMRLKHRSTWLGRNETKGLLRTNFARPAVSGVGAGSANQRKSLGFPRLDQDFGEFE